jgi:subtilisin family serine protease
MKRLGIIVLIATCLLATPVWASELSWDNKSRIAQGAAYVPGELLVKYKPSVRAAASEHYQTRWGISTLRSFRSIGVQHVKLPEGMTVDEALEIYRDDPDVEYAEPNYYWYVTATPDDTYFNQLWGLHNTGQSVNGTSGTPDADIDALEVWDITTGSSSVVVAVIDSGADYSHPDLSDNIWTNPDEIAGNGIDDDGNTYVDDVRGWDFVDDDNDPIDSNDHGTHVAGTVAAVGNNSTGVTGVSWTAKIMVLRFLNAFGSGTTADAISSIEYANTKGAHVINNSWGGGSFSQSLKNAIDASSAVVVCAAGNDGTDNDNTPHYPSNYTSSNIIAVAATDQHDNLASFSNYGATSVDVGAPGKNIYSCQPGRQTVWSDNFDDGSMSNWTTGGTKNTWDTTSSLSFSGSYSLTDSPGGDYQNNTDSWARAPVVDLSSYSGVKLGFQLRGTSEAGYDFLYVETSNDGSSWMSRNILIGSTIYSRISGTSSGNWLSASVDLGDYDGTGTVYFRFRFTSDSLIDADGWYIDDVGVIAASSSYNGTEYQFMDGTSMAAPHVSGVAALIKAHNPSLTNTEIKAAIENNVDPKASLSGKVATGGRVNVSNALFLPAPSDLSGTTVSASQIDLSWTDNSPNESGFKIERKKGSGGTYSQIATVTANVASYSDTGLSEATSYYYRVRASSSAGNSSYSNEASATTYPAAPSGLSAEALTSSQINLSWIDNSSGESGFKIERKGGSGGTYSQKATVAANVTGYSDSGLTASTSYYYRVRAYNDADNSTYSNEATATTFSSGGGGGSGGGCFIDTTVYGSQMKPHHKLLHER